MGNTYAARQGMAGSGTARLGMELLQGVAGHGTVRCGPARQGVAWNIYVVRRGEARLGLAWRGTAGLGRAWNTYMAWFGLVRLGIGLVRYGVVWHGQYLTRLGKVGQGRAGQGMGSTNRESSKWPVQKRFCESLFKPGLHHQG